MRQRQPEDTGENGLQLTAAEQSTSSDARGHVPVGLEAAGPAEADGHRLARPEPSSF